jgi:Protein of unknown function (DUF2971)
LKDSERMWFGYAENHKGISLRIEPNLAKDSKFQLFRPVVYRKTRPPLYEDTLEFTAGSLFGNQADRVRLSLDKLMYSKTLEWKHEREYRLVTPLRNGEIPWNTLLFHPEEITELYLGSAMERADMDEIVGMARAVNPEIAFFGTKRSADGKLKFDRI